MALVFVYSKSFSVSVKCPEDFLVITRDQHSLSWTAAAEEQTDTFIQQRSAFVLVQEAANRRAQVSVYFSDSDQ